MFEINSSILLNIKKNFETYSKEHKFLRLSFQDAHEDILEEVKYLDVKLAEFLEIFDKNDI